MSSLYNGKINGCPEGLLSGEKVFIVPIGVINIITTSPLKGLLNQSRAGGPNGDQREETDSLERSLATAFTQHPQPSR